jgi:23S rRNA G2069 N7-methylase RlmK/C1962 C5-methylase RlmI
MLMYETRMCGGPIGRGCRWSQEDAVRYMKDAVRDTWRRYSLIVLDPPPRFGRNRKQSDW